MASEWREKTLDQLGRIVTGKTPPSTCPEHFGGIVPFVTPTDFDGRRIIDTTARYLTLQGVESIGNCRLPSRAVMVSCIGSDMGKAAIAGHNCVTNQQINSIVIESSDDPLFVYYNLSLRKTEIRIAAGGSAQPILNKSAFGRMSILLPEANEQKAVVHILGTLDDKIELNRKMNETLEAMARALFQSWFVDFDPVRAKAEGRDPGLPAHIAALFPDSFEPSELGPIPKGWRVGSLSDVVLLNPESWSRSTKPEIIPYIDLANTKWGRIEAITVYSKEDAPSRAQRVLRCGDTIVGTVRPGNGSYALIAEDGLTGSTGFAVLRPRKSEYREFIYLTATAQDNMESLAHLADGGAYPAVRPEVVAAKQIVMPPDPVISNFAKLAEPSISRLAQAERESHNLAALRDTLLPKLISGELRVKTSQSEQSAPAEVCNG